ncbi:hypothetical protein CASFOL_028725 [Castilleja foliolosa]|uniref:Uncharacterized protein n=1 Tax=Castilleja foliolosa TaxID=1961234 RepID=A0ABD3CFB2_9LAMI
MTSSEYDKSAKHIDDRFDKCSDFNKQLILSSLKIHHPTEELKAMVFAVIARIIKCGGGSIVAFIYILEQILDRFTMIAPLHVHVRPVLQQQISIVRYHVPIIQRNSAFGDCSTIIRPLVHRIPIVVELCGFNKFFWKVLLAPIVQHTRRLLVCKTTWSMHHEIVDGIIVRWIRMFVWNFSRNATIDLGNRGQFVLGLQKEYNDDSLLVVCRYDKLPTAAEIDRCISAEIPDKHTDPAYYDAVNNFMMHGPCGLANKKSPCMLNNRCKKYFPKEFVESTRFDDDGYPVYKRTDNGRTISKGGVSLDNRYISPCEAMWRIFKYDIHYRDPPVERLSFHLPNDQNVYYSDKQPLSSVFANEEIRTTMFEAWFKANDKHHALARNLTYTEFPQKFMWIDKTKEWKPRERGFSLGKAYYVPPGSGDAYYQRCLINVIRGAKCHEDMMKVNNIQYESYKDACYALGIIEDDKEYIDGIKDASYWTSAQSLRRLFCTHV